MEKGYTQSESQGAQNSAQPNPATSGHPTKPRADGNDARGRSKARRLDSPHVYAGAAPASPLSEAHLHKLRGVSPEVRDARGYASIKDGLALESLGFPPSMNPALLIPWHDVDGGVSYQIRPNVPLPDGPKYLFAKGHRNRLDVPPTCRADLGNPRKPLWIAEGAIKPDYLASRGACAVGTAGVTGWRGTNEQGGKNALACFDSVALNDRAVYICSDSDIKHNANVAKQAHDLRRFLESKRARVLFVLIPDGPNGEKQGPDDFLNAGGTLEELTSFAASLLPNEKGAPPEPDEWSEPLPLKNALIPVPPLPPVLIPASLRPWVLDCARRVGVAPDYIAVAALVGLASLVGNTVSIRPKQHDDWRVVPNLWGAGVGSPSVKKSPAIAEALKPFARLKALALERYQGELKEWQAGAVIDELAADALKSDLKKRQKSGATRDELKEFITRNGAAENAKPTLKTYSVQDATIEALTNVLARNPRGFLVERDELTGWIRALDKQGHEQDRAFFLEAFNGTATNQQYERIGRGTIIVPHFTLSIFGTIQPLPFARLIRAASSGEGADGFVSRFQMLVYPDALPEYIHVDEWPDTDAKNRAFAVFEALDALTPDAAGAQCDDDGQHHFLRFDAQAQDVFTHWLVDLENRLPLMERLVEQHLAKYRSLMPSLALLFHLIAVADGGAQGGTVGEQAAMMAADWCAFLEAHARRIYGAAGDGATDGAELIAARFGQLSNPFTARDVYRKQWTGLGKIEEVESALARLEDRDWIRPQYVGGESGRPTTRYWKHPAKVGEK